MKNNFIQKLKYAVLAVFLSTANVVYSKPVAQVNSNLSLSKFLIAMCAILVFTIVVYLGLLLYNKFFVSNHLKNMDLYNDSLEAPSDTENAINTFISKNRLR